MPSNVHVLANIGDLHIDVKMDSLRTEIPFRTELHFRCFRNTTERLLKLLRSNLRHYAQNKKKQLTIFMKFHIEKFC